LVQVKIYRITEARSINPGIAKQECYNQKHIGQKPITYLLHFILILPCDVIELKFVDSGSPVQKREIP
jgi:hypothetical protein